MEKLTADNITFEKLINNAYDRVIANYENFLSMEKEIPATIFNNEMTSIDKVCSNIKETAGKFPLTFFFDEYNGELVSRKTFELLNNIIQNNASNGFLLNSSLLSSKDEFFNCRKLDCKNLKQDKLLAGARTTTDGKERSASTLEYERDLVMKELKNQEYGFEKKTLLGEHGERTYKFADQKVQKIYESIQSRYDYMIKKNKEEEALFE